MQKILVATDFSPHSDAALTLALDLAGHYHASVTLLHVCMDPSPAYYAGGAYVASPEQVADRVAEAAKQLGELCARTPMGGVAVDITTRVGDAATEIVRHAAEHGHDFIVVGTHGRRGFGRLVLGSVAELVVRTAGVPVLTARPPAAAAVASAKAAAIRPSAPAAPPAGSTSTR
jgi:nucleotide-binding universal stress UspA family protein